MSQKGLTPKILLIEDEPKVVSLLTKGLEDNGYTVESASDGLSGLNKATENFYNLIILDINLPSINGYEVCKRLRKKNKEVPVLMLTALDSTNDKLLGFESGIDYYLPKPFEFMELLAIAKNLIKRLGDHKPQPITYQIADLTLNTATMEVNRAGKKIDLTAKEFSLLHYFLMNKGRVITRSEIAEKIWEINFDTGTNVIDVYINFLRKKIEKDFSSKLIHTLIGKGYVLKESYNEN